MPDATGREGRSHLRREQAGLEVSALAQAVRAQLGDDDGPLGGEVLEPGDVALEVLVVLEVDVPGVVVDAADAQVLGGRVVDVRDERTGVRRPDGVGEALQEGLHRRGAVPAHDARGDLVADAEGQDGRVAGAAAHAVGHAARGSGPAARVWSRNVMCSSQGMSTATQRPWRLGGIEQPRGRHRVDADGVDAGRGHLREVRVGLRRVVAVVAGRAGQERAVRDAADPELLVADVEEAARTRADAGRRRVEDRVAAGRRHASG